MALLAAHRIHINEVEAPFNTIEGKLAWTVDVKLDNMLIHSRLLLHDPWSEQQHAQFWQSLKTLAPEYRDLQDRLQQAQLRGHHAPMKKILGQIEKNNSEAESVSTLLKCYNECLYRQLAFPGSRLRSPKVVIDVHEFCTYELSSNERTVQCIHWELLEEPILWQMSTVRDILVKRIVLQSPHSGLRRPAPGIQKVKSWPTRQGSGSVIHVLLVIARDLSPQRRGYQSPSTMASLSDDVNPSQAQLAILGVRQKLAASNKNHNIELDIVRPGRFKEFQKHLERTTAVKGKGYYHVVHLDMHGFVKKTSQGSRSHHSATLGFLDDELTGLQEHSAQDIAQVLHEHAVGSAVINACSSAEASQGVGANLSRTFIRSGITNVLAMTNKISSAATLNLLITFYESLLLDTRTFSQAAAIARRELRESVYRFGGEARSQQIQDWFIPVFYTDGTDRQIDTHKTERHRSLRACDIVAHLAIAMIATVVGTLIAMASGISRFMPTAFSRYRLGWTHITDWDLVEYWKHTAHYVSESRVLVTVENSTLAIQSCCGTGSILDAGVLLALDNDILALEACLTEFRIVAWSVPLETDISTMMRHLARLWCSTGFTSRVLFLNSTQFMEDRSAEIVHLINEMSRSNGHRKVCTYNETQPPGFASVTTPTLTIIITDMNALFPQKPDQRSRNGQAIFLDFVNRLPAKTDGLYPSSRPYLIFVGSQPVSWWSRIFSNMESDWGHCLRKRKPIFRRSDATDTLNTNLRFC